MERETTVAEDVQQRIGIVFLVFASLMMAICEAEVIRGMWFRPAPFSHIKGIFLPIIVACPGLYGWLFQMTLKQSVQGGDLAPGLRARLSFFISLLIMLTYVGLTDLAELAF
jgi:hypothetical protein